MPPHRGQALRGYSHRSGASPCVHPVHTIPRPAPYTTPSKAGERGSAASSMSEPCLMKAHLPVHPSRGGGCARSAERPPSVAATATESPASSGGHTTRARCTSTTCVAHASARPRPRGLGVSPCPDDGHAAGQAPLVTSRPDLGHNSAPDLGHRHASPLLGARDARTEPRQQARRHDSCAPASTLYRARRLWQQSTVGPRPPCAGIPPLSGGNSM